LQGHASEFCKTCWLDESVGKSSLREEYNKRLAKHVNLRDIAKSKNFKSDSLPIGFDLNLGNICNFKCVMCIPSLSSRLQSERQQHAVEFQKLTFLNDKLDFDFDWPDKQPFQTLLKQAMPDVKILELKGGEPLLIRDVHEAIASIQNKSQSVIAITTNGSVEFTDEFLQTLSEFQRIWLNVSVDGISTHGEYVRHGSSWTKTHDTICKVSRLANCTFRISTVLQFYSSLTLPHIVDYAIQNELDMEILICQHPEFLHINAMLPSHHQSLLDCIEKTQQQRPDLQWLQTIVGYLKNYNFDATLHEQCAKYTQTLDRVRKNSLPEVQALFRDA
jgi:uncharacterized Fe-S cluster-containing radical SAM superfamily protein